MIAITQKWSVVSNTQRSCLKSIKFFCDKYVEQCADYAISNLIVNRNYFGFMSLIGCNNGTTRNGYFWERLQKNHFEINAFKVSVVIEVQHEIKTSAVVC
jgi:hypothetical protein